MEQSVGAGAGAACWNKSISTSKNLSSSSFKLRSPSLNSVRLRRVFDIFDKNKDSIISQEELGLALGLLGLQADSSELKLMVESYIQPGSVGLKYEDFEALHQSLNNAFFARCNNMHDHNNNNAEEEEERDLLEAFKVFDEDRDGYISACELQAVLWKLGLQEEGEELGRVEMMISNVDQDHDGRVDFLEFKDMMRTHLIAPPLP